MPLVQRDDGPVCERCLEPARWHSPDTETGIAPAVLVEADLERVELAEDLAAGLLRLEPALDRDLLIQVWPGSGCVAVQSWIGGHDNAAVHSVEMQARPRSVGCGGNSDRFRTLAFAEGAVVWNHAVVVGRIVVQPGHGVAGDVAHIQAVIPRDQRREAGIGGHVEDVGRGCGAVGRHGPACGEAAGGRRRMRIGLGADQAVAVNPVRGGTSEREVVERAVVAVRAQIGERGQSRVVAAGNALVARVVCRQTCLGTGKLAVHACPDLVRRACHTPHGYLVDAALEEVGGSAVVPVLSDREQRVGRWPDCGCEGHLHGSVDIERAVVRRVDRQCHVVPLAGGEGVGADSATAIVEIEAVGGRIVGQEEEVASCGGVEGRDNVIATAALGRTHPRLNGQRATGHIGGDAVRGHVVAATVEVQGIPRRERVVCEHELTVIRVTAADEQNCVGVGGACGSRMGPGTVAVAAAGLEPNSLGNSQVILGELLLCPETEAGVEVGGAAGIRVGPDNPILVVHRCARRAEVWRAQKVAGDHGCVAHGISDDAHVELNPREGDRRRNPTGGDRRRKFCAADAAGERDGGVHPVRGRFHVGQGAIMAVAGDVGESRAARAIVAAPIGDQPRLRPV